MRAASIFLCSFLIALSMLCKTGHAFLRNSFASSSRMQLRTLSMSANAQANTFTTNAVPKIAVTTAEALTFSGDLLVIPFYQPSSDAAKKDKKVSLQELKDSIPAVSDDIKTLVSEILNEEVFKADAASKQLVRVGGSSGVKYVALVGMGPKKDSAKKLVGTVGTLGSTVSALAKEAKAEKVGLVAPEGFADFSPFVLAVQDSLYEDTRFKKEPEGGFPKLKWQSLELLGLPSATGSFESAEMIAEGVQFAKDLVGENMEQYGM
jgi:leucyl aminopeptidase